MARRLLTSSMTSRDCVTS